MATFFFIFKIIIVLLIAGLLVGICILIIKSLPFRPKFRVLQTLGSAKKDRVSNVQYQAITRHREVIRKKWEKLLERIKSGDERDLRLAIIEADTLVDEILIQHEHPGKDMGERLKSMHPGEIENLDDLWEAHKIRNRIAHESGFHITSEESRKIINIYHKTLKDLLEREVELV